ncbi:Epoxide hydrolase 4 [Gryllus bimaculatus]|nr:Epoxide hydrolase 4 [Gryllus bimaculatus]
MGLIRAIVGKTIVWSVALFYTFTVLASLINIKLHYVENGDSSKPLMLFVHGFPELWYSWRHQIKEFSSDYWTIALDMRGYGESEKPDGVQNYKMKYLLDDIKELVTALGTYSSSKSHIFRK